MGNTESCSRWRVEFACRGLINMYSGIWFDFGFSRFFGAGGCSGELSIDAIYCSLPSSYSSSVNSLVCHQAGIWLFCIISLLELLDNIS